MTWRSFQDEAFRLTEKEVEKLTPYILRQYEEAIKAINKDLEKVYATILSGIPPDDYYNEMLKYDRLTKLEESVRQQYNIYSKRAGKAVGDAGKIGSSNTFYRLQYSHVWLIPGIDFALLPDNLVEMSVFGSTEAWKKYTNSLQEKIFDSAGNYFPQSGTLSEFLVSNRVKELEQIQRSITQGLLQGHSYTKTSRAVRDVIGRHLTKDGVRHVSGAMANTMRIVRTESTRIMNEAATANTELARSQGIDVVRFWNAALDNRTRPVHAALDDKPEDKNGMFHSQVGPVSGPGQFPTVGQNVHCRCTTFESVDGSKPSIRRGVNIAKYEKELAKAKAQGMKGVTAEKRAAARSKELFNYKGFEQWANDNGIKKNKFGQYYNFKK